MSPPAQHSARHLATAQKVFNGWNSYWKLYIKLKVWVILFINYNVTVIFQNMGHMKEKSFVV